MNTAQGIINYAGSHNIQLSSRDGQLILSAPRELLTDNFLKSAKQHKPEILEALSKKQDAQTLINLACQGLAITPSQFIAICSEEDIEDISGGTIPFEELRAYACSFVHGIKSGRILLHPTTGALVKHGIEGLLE